MTQGLVSVVSKDGKVLMKISVGSNGFRAKHTANVIKKEWPISPERAQQISEQKEFGSEDDRVIMTSSQIIVKDPESIGPLFAEKFGDPNFNPRWELGEADHVVVVTV